MDPINDPPGMTPQMAAHLWGYLRDNGVAQDDDWLGGDIAGMPFRVKDHGQDASLAIDRRYAGLTPEQKLAVKMNLNSGRYYNKDLIPKAAPRTIEIANESWSLRFKSSDYGMNIFRGDQYDTYWNGKTWVQIFNITLTGDHERFQHEVSLLRLFASNWMYDEPEKNDIASMLKKWTTLVSQYGKSTMITTMAQQQALRYHSSVYLYDIEMSFDKSHASVLGIFEDNKPLPKNRSLTVLKNRS